VIQLRHRQPSLWHSGLAKDIEDLWEPWMKEVDQLLEDAALVESVYDAQGKRHPKSRTRGRTQTPAEVALRLLICRKRVGSELGSAGGPGAKAASAY
jgi:IS5 family transposase